MRSIPRRTLRTLLSASSLFVLLNFLFMLLAIEARHWQAGIATGCWEAVDLDSNGFGLSALKISLFLGQTLAAVVFSFILIIDLARRRRKASGFEIFIFLSLILLSSWFAKRSFGEWNRFLHSYLTDNICYNPENSFCACVMNFEAASKEHR